MDTKALEEIGLTQGEIKVYLALLELGESSAGTILEKAKVQNSVFHLCINQLIEKGFVSYAKKNKFRLYKAADPNNLLIYLKDKEKQIQELLPELKSKQSLKIGKEQVELFEGIKGIITLLNELITDAKKGDEFLFFSPEIEENEEIQKFYEKYDLKRKEKGLSVKGIAPENHKQFFEKRKYIKMKYTKIPLPANTGMCNDRVAIISWEEKPMGILIYSKHIAKKQKDFFNALWNFCK
ncbi:MAG: TrmB family transcriptional regulator [Nanoarchaeota archaeon]